MLQAMLTKLATGQISTGKAAQQQQQQQQAGPLWSALEQVSCMLLDAATDEPIAVCVVASMCHVLSMSRAAVHLVTHVLLPRRCRALEESLTHSLTEYTPTCLQAAHGCPARCWEHWSAP
jgi:hypothetical protein